MLRVGLTGGYATGKSFVAKELQRRGCFLIYADELGHQVLSPGGDAYLPTLERFGPGILSADGLIDRKKLGDQVFASPELLQVLNGFVHPAVFHLESQMIEEFARETQGGIAVVEAAILIETGRYQTFDRLILTACSQETQIARGMERDGLKRQQVLDRLSKQMPLEQKKKYADYVIDTDTPKSATLAQVADVFERLKVTQELKG